MVKDKQSAKVIHKIGAIILRNKKLLVVRKKMPGRIEFIIPGGRKEDDETQEQTLARELREELGVQLKSFSYFGSFDEEAIFEKIPLHMDVYYVKVEGYLEPRSEIKEYLWIDRNYKDKGIKLGSVLELHVVPRLIKQGLM